ncbi:hypothetical protein CDV36_012594 [Fusarium kuroshium]|uniref:Pesticidal crystal protein N-terminal domain-containing protein n=1 Tax=Fusarium kuroshium TaxID=2010991 RepID=A0A3M2RSF7_9HYPO|nr:hypothetical protein CDV36_012594 [Fusarium kuroshium]
MAKWTLWLMGFATLSTASITVQVSDVEPIPLRTEGIAKSVDDLFRRSCPEEVSENSEDPQHSLLLSSFSNLENTYPSSDGFIRGVIDAWAHHQHLQLRPDEVWFEILAQLNFYMGAHAEELRDLFVSHAKKEEILVKEVSWEAIIAGFGGEIQKRVKTEWLLDWVMPGFSTTTKDDEVTATVLMMGLMQYFFEFSGMIVCGIPSVTLLGEREDWVRLLDKIDHLKDFGQEPARFAKNLRPILTRFVGTWDHPESEETKSFWEQIVRAKKKFSCGAGAVEWDVSGWITGFLHFERSGAPRIDPNEEVWVGKNSVVLDGVVYEPEAMESITIGYAKAPLKMVDYPTPGTDTTAYLLAGNVGIERKEEEGRVTARPVSGWFMYTPADANSTAGPLFGNRRELEVIAEGVDTCKGTKVERPDL